jgi:hypothetical protein
MKSNPIGEITRLSLPTLSGIQRRTTFRLPSRYGTTAPQAPLCSSAHPPVTTPPTVSWKPSAHPPAACPDSKSVLPSTAISAAAASKPHSNISYRWVQSTKAAGLPRAARLPSGLQYQDRSAWPGKSHTMNRPLRKQSTRNPCRSRLSSLTSLSSHISTRKLEVNVPLREQPLQDSSQTNMRLPAPVSNYLRPARSRIEIQSTTTTK